VISFLKNFLKKKIQLFFSYIFRINEKIIILEKINLNNGSLLIKSLLTKDTKKINDYEASIFSQWGEDGIIQYLIHKLKIEKEGIFVEFGVDDYVESNTRYLLFKNNWNGFVIDSNKDNINKIKNSYYFWKYNLEAQCHFITINNINKIISSFLKKRKLDLMSIDLDGNDYWILKCLSLNVFRPKILICEYNSIFGNKIGVTVPYQEDFNRNINKKYSKVYYGASIKALVNLADSKGYLFLGSNSNGNNLFFVDKLYKKKFNKVSFFNGYKKNKFKEIAHENYNTIKNSLNNKKFYDTDACKIIKLNVDKI